MSILSISSIAGILLILGALLTYLGRIYFSVMFYVIADFLWVVNSYIQSDWTGFVLTGVGTLLAIGCLIKMHLGLYNRDIIKNRG